MYLPAGVLGLVASAWFLLESVALATVLGTWVFFLAGGLVAALGVLTGVLCLKRRRRGAVASGLLHSVVALLQLSLAGSCQSLAALLPGALVPAHQGSDDPVLLVATGLPQLGLSLLSAIFAFVAAHRAALDDVAREGTLMDQRAHAFERDPGGSPPPGAGPPPGRAP